ncbi:MAG: thermonuclease family protein [Burkholderiales bacterium]
MMPSFRYPACMALIQVLIVALALFGAAPWDGAVRPAAAQALPRVIEGRAIDVADGDTFVLLDDLGKRWRVRLAGIDAPESSQPWADRSRQKLREWLSDERVLLAPIKTDPYGRLVARILVPSADPASERVDAGLMLVESGLAWHFKRYKADQSPAEFAAFAEAENRARQAHRGLWSEPDPEPPWAYRERQRAARR